MLSKFFCRNPRGAKSGRKIDLSEYELPNLSLCRDIFDFVHDMCQFYKIELKIGGSLRERNRIHFIKWRWCPPEVSISFCPWIMDMLAWLQDLQRGGLMAWSRDMKRGLQKDVAMEQWCGSVKYALAWFL